ncbi:MAG: hypothetical protein PHR28_09145 [candidate division Zixibacteria bacterium]|nr:hypothetical protein [candidate division Zixibacteria bacterium]
MKLIDDMFIVHRARSHLYSEYSAGEVAYVGKGLSDNAVVGFVEPLPKDKVFDFPGITVSAFCEATVQIPPFIACGRAGNGLVALEPKTPLSLGQLAYYAAYINQALRWRFSWYWQTTADRLRRLPIPDEAPRHSFDVRGILPEEKASKSICLELSIKLFALGELYDLVPGDFHNAGILETGPIPLVSCGDLDNGIIKYIAPNDYVYRNKFTIALNGRPLTAKYHPYAFSAKDDVAICLPYSPMQLTTDMFILATLNRERWRYSYYRKCYIDKLKRFRLPLPARHNQVDEDAIRTLVVTSSYWEFIKTHLPNPV